VRTKADGVGSANNLWLDREPSVDEIMTAIQKRDLSRYQELVFCGYGEPMMRAQDIIDICKKIEASISCPGASRLRIGEDAVQIMHKARRTETYYDRGRRHV
jgi:MoaA/NifB/PqqE/SkfB family radical SAM enzyme